MKLMHCIRTAQIRIALPALLFATLLTATARPVSENNGLVLKWNQLIADTVALGVQPPTIRPDRTYAMMHVAMFDAINSIEKRYTPYMFEVRASAGASAVAAGAQAAHDVLVALYPGQKAVYDQALSEDLAGIPPGLLRQGVQIGKSIAASVVAWRSTDRWGVTPPPYSLVIAPGNWQPTPTTFTPARFTHYPYVVPFAIHSVADFLVDAPPSLQSQEYTTAYNEVKDLGSVNSLTRTADQRLIALLHGSVGTFATPNTVWNDIARNVTRTQELNLLDAARLFALLNIAFHDALQVSFAGKFTYGLWRPVTAIQSDDGNPNTLQDLNWRPLLSAPPYPTYPGNAAALSAASSTILALALGNDHIPFEITFKGNGAADVTRSYSSFSEFAEEQAMSRIWGGIHFRFDSEASQETSVELAEWIYSNYMMPR